MITIFTPTFNRGYIINKLYDSLKNQTNMDFEWLVVDDGSTDNTEEIFKEIESEGIINVRYVKKKNGGKHTATNLGLNLAKRELFFVVDSDDFLANNAVERILYHYAGIENNDDYCGVCGLKGYFNGNIIGSKIEYEVLESTIIDYRFKLGFTGDKADVFKLKFLKEHSFPEYPNEKWCPLSIVWNRFGSKLKVRYFNEVIYFAEYLTDGISLNRLKIRKNSPNNTMQYYSELSTYDIPITEKLKASINYWRFSFYSNTPLRDKVKNIGLTKSIFGFPSGFILFLFDTNMPLYKRFLDPNKKILKGQKN